MSAEQLHKGNNKITGPSGKVSKCVMRSVVLKMFMHFTELHNHSYIKSDRCYRSGAVNYQTNATRKLLLPDKHPNPPKPDS